MRLASFLQPLFRLRPQRRLAALGLVGVAICAVPLVQVLRFQGLEIELARAAMAGLDPVAGALAVQRSVIEHRDLSSLWLRGQPEVDAPRRQRQVEVDARLALLQQTLERRGDSRASLEATAMTRDWGELVERILSRSLQPADSDAGHRLLVEQAIQVIDLVAAALPLQQSGDPLLVPVTAPVLAAVSSGLPRLSAALLRLPQPGAPVGAAERKSWAADVKATEALLETVLQPIGEARPVGPLLQDRQLPDAVARSLAASHVHLRLLMDPRATPEGLAATQRQALQAHFGVVNAAQATLGLLADAQLRALDARRSHSLWGIGVLAALTLALMGTWLLGGSQRHEAATAPADERPRTDGHWPVRRTARQLIDRLRGAAAPHPAPGAAHDVPRRDAAVKPARKPQA